MPAMLLAAVMLAMLLLAPAGCTRVDPLRLHPQNPHYFEFRGKPTVLITSAEHYGAVLNADFDYAKYLDTLAADRMNHTRMWVGVYCEGEGQLGIAGNTLAPAAGRFICPWARSDESGYANGGNKFDLMCFDDAYFTRLRDFISKASARGIVVEVNLFCPFYEDGMWNLSPMNARNNVNGLGEIPRDDVYTLDRHGGLLAVQEALVRKVVTELKDFDNIFFEVMNEPYIRKVPMEWQRRMIGCVVATQKQLGTSHLISLNIANEKGKVEEAHPAVSIFNFHYAWPPEAVAMNYALKGVIGENETGGRIHADYFYRREGWAFILAGGGLYNNLDYSFTAGHEDGTFEYPPGQPGGGSAALRRQLRILSDFIHGFDFVRMAPDHAAVQAQLPRELTAYALTEPAKQYAIYICHTTNEPPGRATSVALSLDLPAGRYRVEWVNTLTGQMESQQTDHPGGPLRLVSPAFEFDVALGIVLTGG